MTIDRNYDEGGVPVRGESSEPSGGIYSLPALGKAFAVARRFFDQMAPQDADPTGVRVGKEALRWGSVVGGAVVGGAVMAIVAL
jgi:hypothetical protein